MFALSRRHFLASTATAAVSGAAAMKLSGYSANAAELDPAVISVESRIIDVNGKPAKIFGLS